MARPLRPLLQPLLQDMRVHQRKGAAGHFSVRRKATVRAEPSIHTLVRELKKGLQDLGVKRNEVTREHR